MGQQFDEFSKALASGVSRRRALQLLVGGAIAAITGGLAFARPARAVHPNKAEDATITSVTFCNYLYGTGTSQANACIAAAAHGTGPYYEFGPKAPCCAHHPCSKHEKCMCVRGVPICIPHP
jgi:hypothetical protein